ncbi:MAG TPA: hypothetical protein VLC98_06750 [Phnomibacter sp.]|nr:hypothetical protein [Phnomibacter sp.]
MFQILLRANNFAEALVQGAIIGLFLLLFFLAASAIVKWLSRKSNKETLPANAASFRDPIEKDISIQLSTSNTEKKVSIFRKYYNYFFRNNWSKGYTRLIAVGSFFLPLLCAVILYIGSKTEWTNQYTGETMYYYDDAAMIIGFILSYICYWVIYCIIIWIMKGFQEGKTMS